MSGQRTRRAIFSNYESWYCSDATPDEEYDMLAPRQMVCGSTRIADRSLRKIIAEQLAAPFSENSSGPRQTRRLRYGRSKAIAPSYGGPCGERNRKFPRMLLPRLLPTRQTPPSCSQRLALTTPLSGHAPESFGWKRNPCLGRARSLKTIKDWCGPKKHGFRTKSGTLGCRCPLCPLATESKSQLI